jgi:hypothetical protein
MTRAVDELWTVAREKPQVDANALAAAIETAAAEPDDALDYRTRLLIRDGLRALESHWGKNRFARWLTASSARENIVRACDPTYLDGNPNEIGFPSLARRVVDAIQPEDVERFLRDLSRRVSHPTRLIIGGSIPLILGGQITRTTEDVDAVNEIPAELRDQHEFLDELREVHGLRLAHFQSHYLPSGWERRVHSLGNFGQLQVFLVDGCDIFVGKLFSLRKKDRADLVALASQLSRETIVHRVREETAGFRSDPRLLDAAKQNWYVLFGEELPS